jgi:hypothetical protein
MTISLLSLGLAVVLAIAWVAKFGGRLPSTLGDRACQGASWLTVFPNTSKDQIREFLSLFVASFGFRKSEQLKLGPSDSILRIYRTLYPYRWQPDALEFETLSRELRNRYALDLTALWKEDLTLGELFTETLMASRAVGAA